MATTVVLGLPQAQARLTRLGALVATSLPLILMAGALPISNRAKLMAPYRTGNLRRSIHIEATGATEVTVGTDLVYAAAQEFGRPDINLPAHPYLRPALDGGVVEATASMQRALAALVANA